MNAIRIATVADPLHDPASAARAARVLRLGEAMGLTGADETFDRLDLDAVRRVARAAAAAGIGRDAATLLLRRSAPSPEILSEAIDRLGDALEDSPLPGPELRVLARVFDIDRLVPLVGASAVSIRRYASGTRPIPDALATRVHLLALVVAELRGAYNDVGIRRWFERRRTRLDGRSPGDVLSGSPDPDDAGPQAVLALARSLSGSGAT